MTPEAHGPSARAVDSLNFLNVIRLHETAPFYGMRFISRRAIKEPDDQGIKNRFIKHANVHNATLYTGRIGAWEA